MGIKPLSQQFVDDVHSVIDKYRGEGLTIAELIGGLEIVKLDSYAEATADEEDEII